MVKVITGQRAQSWYKKHLCQRFCHFLLQIGNIIVCFSAQLNQRGQFALSRLAHQFISVFLKSQNLI